MSVTPEQQKNIDTIYKILDCARFGKIHEVENYFDKDLILYNAPGLPYGGTYHGWEGYVEQCKKLDNFWTNAVHSEREYIPVGEDRVFIHFWIDRDIAHSGQHIKMPIVALWEFVNGKVKQIRPFYFDSKEIFDKSQM